MPKDDDKVLNTARAGSWAAAAAASMDVKRRSQEAHQKYEDKFCAPAHSAKVEAVTKIVGDFFRVKEIFENQRENRGQPFTVIKVCNHTFPRVSFAEKDRRFRDPLAELGVEPIATSTNSLLFRIYCD
jgi:hypothetical protein|tara:strand:- start:1539 stop:1922 length:384 start_codon:yes stop_codon:yes gene_type:complete